MLLNMTVRRPSRSLRIPPTVADTIRTTAPKAPAARMAAREKCNSDLANPGKYVLVMKDSVKMISMVPLVSTSVRGLSVMTCRSGDLTSWW
ncbi:Uncharacterised protein [Mycobacteroides abscessus subsp. abscessus]|nr:Uncharacterised protein [Mycobacteroides abscessus subsp. abscessus]